MKSQDLVGMRFGRLVVARSNEVKGKNRMWECICDCGNTTCVRGDLLRRGTTTSCGCFARELKSQRLKGKPVHQTHGLSVDKSGSGPSPLYRIWAGMKQRCNNPNADNYGFYGGRGIRICEEWDKNFKAFYDWAVKSGYKEGLTIDRKNTDGDYTPENCRWATKKEQANNRLIEFNGETLTLAQWADRIGISSSVLQVRMDRLGWSAEKALTTPLGQREEIR